MVVVVVVWVKKDLMADAVKFEICPKKMCLVQQHHQETGLQKNKNWRRELGTARNFGQLLSRPPPTRAVALRRFDIDPGDSSEYGGH